MREFVFFPDFLIWRFIVLILVLIKPGVWNSDTIALVSVFAARRKCRQVSSRQPASCHGTFLCLQLTTGQGQGENGIGEVLSFLRSTFFGCTSEAVVSVIMMLQIMIGQHMFSSSWDTLHFIFFYFPWPALYTDWPFLCNFHVLFLFARLESQLLY